PAALAMAQQGNAEKALYGRGHGEQAFRQQLPQVNRPKVPAWAVEAPAEMTAASRARPRMRFMGWGPLRAEAQAASGIVLTPAAGPFLGVLFPTARYDVGEEGLIFSRRSAAGASAPARPRGDP